MSSTFTRIGLTAPSADGSDPVVPHTDIRAIGAWMEANAVLCQSGTIALRPAPGKSPRFYRVTDQAGRMDFDTGTTWITVTGDDAGIASLMGVY